MLWETFWNFINPVTGLDYRDNVGKFETNLKIYTWKLQDIRYKRTFHKDREGN